VYRKLFLIVGIFLSFNFSDAYAYIEPGTVTIIVQALIGAMVGVGITLKIYWYKIKEKFAKK
jgi:hypothetical protein